MRNIFLFVVLLLTSIVTIAEDSIRLMTEELPPYQYYEEEGSEKVLTGISIEIIKALQKRVGNQDPIKVYPWSRGLKLLNKYKNSALFSTARTPARENKYKWVGPLAPLEMVFFKRSDDDLQIASIEDAKRVGKVGVTKNVAAYEILTNMGFTNLDVVQSGADTKNIRRLIKGRVDLWPSAYYTGIYEAKKMGVLDQIEVISGTKIMSGHLYIAFNKDTDDKIIEQWQSAFLRLQSEGVIDAITKKYDR